jgi:SAM-dependent methyltransferase
VTRRALSFGAAAASYERYRPGYPPALVDEVLAYAARPVLTALEIGAGTGKATREFAARGLAVTATEPDPAMLDELRRHVPESVTTTVAAFEDLDRLPEHDLVYAAAALHWTEPAGRWERVARLLVPGGVFAWFGGQLHLADLEVEERVRVAGAPYVLDDEVPSPDGTPTESPMQWPGTELLASELFTDVRQSRVERRLSLSAADFVGHLSTISAYLVVPAEDQPALFDAVLAVLPERVELHADVDLHLARRF